MALTIKHRVTLDLSLTSVQATVPFRKGDTAAHEVIFNLRNGTTNVELPVGSVATIAVLNGYEKKGVLDACVVDHVNNQINYIPTVDALKVAGNIACELVVTGPYGETLGTPRFHFLVDDSMTDVTDEEIAEALKASTSWGVIQRTAMNAEAAAQSKIEAQKWANGAGAVEEDPQYENNAKFWADEASSASSDANASAQDAYQYAVNAGKSEKKAKDYATNAEGSKDAAYDYLEAAQDAAEEAKDAADAIKSGAANISVELDSDYILTIKLLSANNEVLGQASVDFPVESSITNIEYDDASKDLTFTLRNGKTTRVPLDSIITGLATVSQLDTGLGVKLDKTTKKSKIYGTDSYGDQTLYSVSGSKGSGTNVIMSQAAVTAELEAIARSIATKGEEITALAAKVNTHSTEILALDGKQSEHESRITELEKSGGGGGVVIAQGKGDSTTAVMSQDATTKEFNKITKKLELQASENICNPDELIVGSVDPATGNVSTNSGYVHTPYIAVNEGDVIRTFTNYSNGSIKASSFRRLAAYDSEGNILPSAGANSSDIYTVPVGVASIIITWYNTIVEGGNTPAILINYDGHPKAAMLYENYYVATADFLKGLTLGVDQLDAEVNAKLNGEQYIEADYINEEVERVNRETLDSEGALNFIFSTDQHVASDFSDNYKMREISKVANSGRFDFCCLGGDMIQSGDTSWYRTTDENGVVTEDNGFRDKKPIVLSHLSEIANIFKNVSIPVYFCQGNHDVCFGAYHGARDYNAYYGYKPGDTNYKDPNAQSLLPKEFFRLLNNRLGETVVWDSDNPNGGYFYKDFARSKIRAIFLQTQDVFNDDGTVVDTVNNTSLNPRIQQKQFAWFCNKALNFMDKGADRANWAVIILSHVNVTLGAISGGSISNNQCELIRGVLDAFMKGGTYTASTPSGDIFPLSANVDFTEQGAVDFICSINGHVHADFAIDIGYAIDNYTSYDEHFINRPAIQVCCASTAERDYSGSALAQYFFVPDREEGNITSECFDIFSIDRVNRKIKTIRFGAGENREISY